MPPKGCGSLRRSRDVRASSASLQNLKYAKKKARPGGAKGRIGIAPERKMRAASVEKTEVLNMRSIPLMTATPIANEMIVR